MWFTVEQDEIDKIKESASVQTRQVNKAGISPAALIRQISAESFFPNQYIEVRGRCLDSSTIEMQEFTDFEENYGIFIINRFKSPQRSASSRLQIL